MLSMFHLSVTLHQLSSKPATTRFGCGEPLPHLPVHSTDCECVCVGRGEKWERVRERERGGEERESERISGLSQSVRVFFPDYFVSCNGPCVPKENWH